MKIAGDVDAPAFGTRLVDDSASRFGKLDIVVNNAAEHSSRAGYRSRAGHAHVGARNSVALVRGQWAFNKP